MNDEMVERVSVFVQKKIKLIKPKLMQVTWIGGEPLLTLDKIHNIYSNFSNYLEDINYKSMMITNGYLLTEKIVTEDLIKLKINTLQITIDGVKEIHDKKRPLQNGKGTFDKIIDNICMTLTKNNNVRINLRVNLDKTNVEEYATIYNELTGIFSNTNRVFVHPGFINDYSLTCKSSSDDYECNLDRNERASFLIEVFKKHNIIATDFLPKSSTSSCMARTKNSYSIGPHGGVYKCTTAVGNKNFSVGTVGSFASSKEKKILKLFLNEQDYLNDKNCSTCKSFFLCDGGCPLLRIKKTLFDEIHDTCYVGKDRIQDFLLIYDKINDISNEN